MFPTDQPVFERIPPSQAQEWVDQVTRPLPAQSVPLAQAGGRVCAQPITAPFDLPRCPSASIDGYALHTADILGASAYSPLRLTLTQRSGGKPLLPGYALLVELGHCLPPGPDGVLPLDRGQVVGDRLEVTGDLPPGEHLEPVGEQARTGDVLVPAGRRLRPQDLALLGLFGIAQVSVFSTPRVRIILASPPPCEANGNMLAALIQRDGGVSQVRLIGNALALGDALSEPAADLCLVVGRSGLGVHDYAPGVLGAVGELDSWGIAMHPGETTGLGRRAGVPVMLLPGTPLACLFAYEWLSGRALRLLGGRSVDWPQARVRARLRRKIASSLGRLEFCRVRLEPVPGDPAAAPEAIPIAISDGHVLATAVEADGFILIQPHSEGHPAGDLVEVLCYGDPT